MPAVKPATATLFGTPPSNGLPTLSQPAPSLAPSTPRAVVLDPQVDMEWDDEEATHVFDNKQHKSPMSSPPAVLKSTPPALPASAKSVPPSASSSASVPPPSVRPAHLPSSPPSAKPSTTAGQFTATEATKPSVSAASLTPAPAPTARKLESASKPPPRSETVPPIRGAEAPSSPVRGLVLGLFAATVAGGVLLYTLAPKRGTLRIDVSSVDGRSLDRIDGMVDGKHECDTSPCLVKNLDRGDHVVKVFANGYDKPEEQSVKVTGDETRVAIVLRSPIRKASVHFGEVPPGAKVVLIGGDERRDVTSFPSDIKDLDPKIAWTVVATLAGAPELRIPLSLTPGEKRDIPLLFAGTTAAPNPSPGVAALPTPTSPVQTPSAPRPAVAAAPVAAATPTPAVDPTPAASEASGPATLNLNSIPASNVVLDGTPLGTTPKLGLSVTSGKHTVLFVNSEQDLRKKVEFTLKAGETKTVAQKLSP